MFESFGRSWNLMKKSYSILQKDKELIVFPMLSAFFGILFFIGLVGSFLVFGEDNSTSLYLSLALFYFVSSFVVIFFNSALIGAANIRLNGGDPTLKDGINIAMSNLVSIIGWALISATVGLIIRSLQSKTRNNPLSNIAVSIVGGVWSLITYFVIPVMVIEKINPIEAIKKSTDLTKTKFGEAFLGGLGFGLISVVAIVIALILAIAGLFLFAPIFAGFAVAFFIGLFVIFVVAISIVTSTLESIFVASLYHYAVTGDDKSGLEIDEMVKEKKLV